MAAFMVEMEAGSNGVAGLTTVWQDLGKPWVSALGLGLVPRMWLGWWQPWRSVHVIGQVQP